MDRLISTGWHWSYGWLRRPDMDDENGFCYEEPDGDLVYSARREHRWACFLQCREDFVTGEQYLCLGDPEGGNNLMQLGLVPRQAPEA